MKKARTTTKTKKPRPEERQGEEGPTALKLVNGARRPMPMPVRALEALAQGRQGCQKMKKKSMKPKLAEKMMNKPSRRRSADLLLLT